MVSKNEFCTHQHCVETCFQVGNLGESQARFSHIFYRWAWYVYILAAPPPNTIFLLVYCSNSLIQTSLPKVMCQLVLHPPYCSMPKLSVFLTMEQYVLFREISSVYITGPQNTPYLICVYTKVLGCFEGQFTNNSSATAPDSEQCNFQVWASAVCVEQHQLNHTPELNTTGHFYCLVVASQNQLLNCHWFESKLFWMTSHMGLKTVHYDRKLGRN